MYSNRMMRRMTREKKMETERMMIYDEIMKKTSLDMLGISDESEYEADVSDIISDTRIYEDDKYMDCDKTSQNFVPTETLRGGDNESPNKYEMLRSKVERYLDDRGLLKQREGERNKEMKNNKTKLVDNINTFL